MKRIVAETIAIASLVYLSACVDTAPIKNFANESSIISSDAGVINGSDAAFAAAQPYLVSSEMKQKFPEALNLGPGTLEFETAKKLAALSAKVLQQYMQVLGNLAGSTTVTTSSDVSSMATSLKTLGITNSALAPALDATSQLANLLATGLVQQTLKDVIKEANPSVQVITAFLAQFVEENATLYDKAKIISGIYWQDLLEDCESRKSRPPVGCRATIALAIDVHSRDENTLNQQIVAADAVASAFKKIGADHQAIVDSAGKFDSAQLIAVLKADEPVLVSAIADLSKL